MLVPRVCVCLSLAFRFIAPVDAVIVSTIQFEITNRVRRTE